MEKKTCTSCLKQKSIDRFEQRIMAHGRISHRNLCRECQRGKKSKNYIANFKEYLRGATSLFVCKKCGENKTGSTFPANSYGRRSPSCNDCHNAYLKKWRNTPGGREGTNRSAAKQRAAHRANRKHYLRSVWSFHTNLKSGKIKKQDSCSICHSKTRVEGHHDDYNRPLCVRWLCKKCHTDWHKHNKPIYPIGDQSHLAKENTASEIGPAKT